MLLALGSLVALLIAEASMRVFAPTFSPLSFDLFYRDRDGQLRLEPLARRQHAHPEWNVSVQINREGFRDIDARPGGEQPLALALGDSLTFGWGVEYEDAFLTRLERAMGGPQTGLRIIKTGTPGTGTTDQLALLRNLLPQYPKVDMVLLGFNVGNDFTDVAEGGASQFDVVDGLLVRRGAAGTGLGPLARTTRWLKRKSYVVQLGAQWLWHRERRRTNAIAVQDRPHAGLAQRDPWLQQFNQIHLREPFPARLQQGVDSALAAFTGMQQLARGHDARFLLLVIPRSIQVYDTDRERYAKAFGAAPAEWDMERPQRILAEWARHNGAEALDLLPALRQAASATSERLYYFPDSHLTSAGHRVVAEQLHAYLTQHPLAAPGSR